MVLPYVCHEILERIWIVTVTQMLIVSLLGQYPGGEISQNVGNDTISLLSLLADNWQTP